MKIVGPYTSPTIYSEHPGTVYLTSSDPGVASVDASVVIPGTRVWRNGLKHGQYLARDSVLQARENCAFFIELQKSNVGPSRIGAIASAMDTQWLAQSVRGDASARINWAIGWNYNNAGTDLFRFAWGQSNTSGSSSTAVLASGYADFSGLSTIRIIITPRSLPDTLIDIYTTTGTSADYAFTRSATTFGTMGGSEYVDIQFPCKFAKMEGGLPSQAQREAFMASGTLPSGLAASYQGGHEIVESAPVFWDTSGNNLDLTAVDVPYWPEAAASGDYTDDPLDPVVPFQPFTITPNSVGTFTITARRRRQGVPDRAPDDEKYETTSETFTITEMPDEVTQYVRLLITTNREGTVDITSSDPLVVTFPASVVVGPTLQYEVLGTVVGAGTSTVTTEMDGTVLATTTVTIEAEPTWIKAGPAQEYLVYLP